MKITFEGTRKEMLSLMDRFEISEEHIDKLLKALNSKENYDEPLVENWFDSASWKTVYLAHVIITKSDDPTDQRDSNGAFLTVGQLIELGFPEREISSRVGGSRRICKRLKIKDIMFFRTVTEKRCYIANSAISTIEQILLDYEGEYRDFLKEEGLSYPEE